MSAPKSGSINGLDLLLILTVTLSWGMNYPIMKYVVMQFPPTTFRTMTFILGSISIGLYAWLKKESLVVPRGERWLTFQLSLPNMVMWHLGLLFGLTLLNSGRTAIIGYTMPVWTLIASVVFFSEKLNARSVWAVLFCLTATLLLAWHELSHFAGQPLGLLYTLGAAIAWGIGNAMMKNSQLSISSVALTFWSLLCGACVFLLFSLVFETERWRWPAWDEWLAVGYGGIVTFSVCYVAWFKVARKLTPVASGLSIMLVPVVGVFGSALVLEEEITREDLMALGFILLAMALVLVPAPRKS
jgi:drug/metabolite transporter (DMT)-like permease